MSGDKMRIQKGWSDLPGRQAGTGYEREQVDYSKEANRKADTGKTRYDLIPAEPLELLAQVYTFGAAKYADRGWEQGIKWSRIFAAIMRHLWAWFKGEDKDPESGLPHPVHAAWGCFALLEFGRTHKELDDRPKPEGMLEVPLLAKTYGQPNEERLAKKVTSLDILSERIKEMSHVPMKWEEFQKNILTKEFREQEQGAVQMDLFKDAPKQEEAWPSYDAQVHGIPGQVVLNPAHQREPQRPLHFGLPTRQ